MIIKNSNKYNVLIAGYKGHIGTYLTNKLEKYYSVYGCDYNAKQDDSYNTTFSRLDLTKIIDVKNYIEKLPQLDILIFLVGLAHAKGKGKDLPEFEKVNFVSLENLLIALKSTGKTPRKIIFASTISVYGERLYQTEYFEETETDPFSPYAITKLQAEQYLLENYTGKSWVLRFSPVYAPNFLLNIDRRTMVKGRFYKVGKGATKLSLCNIRNIKTTIDGIIADVVPAGVYNISDPIPYTYNDLLQSRGAVLVFRIPVLAIKLSHLFGKIGNNLFLKENSIKLITDNIFPSNKIMQYIDLNSTISELN